MVHILETILIITRSKPRYSSLRHHQLSCFLAHHKPHSNSPATHSKLQRYLALFYSIFFSVTIINVWTCTFSIPVTQNFIQYVEFSMATLFVGSFEKFKVLSQGFTVLKCWQYLSFQKGNVQLTSDNLTLDT